MNVKMNVILKWFPLFGQSLIFPIEDIYFYVTVKIGLASLA